MLSNEFRKSPILVIGHRGSPLRAPENSLLSFRKALEDGAHGIELDVRLSRDEEVMVFHDDTLSRLTALRGRFKNYPSEVLSKLNLGTKFGIKENVYIPTLHEVLKSLSQGRPEGRHFQDFIAPLGSEACTSDPKGASSRKYYGKGSHKRLGSPCCSRGSLSAVLGSDRCRNEYGLILSPRDYKSLKDCKKPASVASAVRNECVFYVELKVEGRSKLWNQRLAAKTMDLLIQYDLLERAMLVSFSYPLIKWIKIQNPRFLTGFNFNRGYDLNKPRKDHFQYLDCLCPSYSCLNQRLKDLARKYLLDIITWVVNDEKRLKKAVKLDILGLATDDPTTCLSLLKQTPLRGTPEANR